MNWGSLMKLLVPASTVEPENHILHILIFFAHRLCDSLLGRKFMTNLDSILKSRDIILPTKVCLAKAMVFPVFMYGCESWLWIKLSAEELMLLTCDVGEDSWESLGLQGNPTSPSWRRSVLGVHWKDWCWSWNSNTLATWCEELTHWKRPWCWERLKGGGEGDDRRWDGWMASPTQWLWIWVNSGSWWWTGRPGMLQFMESQRVEQDWMTELNWTVWLRSKSKWDYKTFSGKSASLSPQVVPVFDLHITDDANLRRALLHTKGILQEQNCCVIRKYAGRE